MSIRIDGPLNAATEYNARNTEVGDLILVENALILRCYQSHLDPDCCIDLNNPCENPYLFVNVLNPEETWSGCGCEQYGPTWAGVKVDGTITLEVRS